MAIKPSFLLKKKPPAAEKSDFQKAADAIMLSTYTPFSVIVDEAMEIVHFNGNTNDYLEQPQGKPTLNLFKMARHGLAYELRNILLKASKHKGSIKKANISVHVKDALQTISIEAISLPNTIEPHYLVIFHVDHSEGMGKAAKENNRSAADKPGDKKQVMLQQRIKELERELMQVHEDMRAVTEGQEAANEELQSANEELQSSSEELQSMTEELETGKEELESTNEELLSMNQQMISLNEQVTTGRDYAESIISTIRQPLLVLDKSYRIKTANSYFYKTFRLTEAETEGTLIFNLAHKQWDIPALRKLLEILPQRKEFTDWEVKHNFKNLGERTLLLNACDFKTKGGEEKLILLSIEDITLRALAEEKMAESERNFRQLSDLMPEKICHADAAGKIIYFNESWLRYTGQTSEQLKTWVWKSIVHPDDLKENNKRWNHSFETGDDFEMEIRVLDENLSYRWHLCRSAAIKDADGKIIKWITATTEIQKQKEEKERLESYAYIVSHDLKTPLQGISNLTNWLLSDYGDKLDTTGKEYLDLLQTQVVRLNGLITGILSYSRVGHHDDDKAIIDLNVLMKELTEMFALTHNVKLKVANKLPVITASKTALIQVFGNLIGNGIKHNDKKDRQIVIGSSDEKTAIKFYVKDNGPGIEKEYHEKVFQMFETLEKKDGSNTGIGLGIVKKIVEREGGKIWIESKPGKGSTFYFTWKR